MLYDGRYDFDHDYDFVVHTPRYDYDYDYDYDHDGVWTDGKPRNQTRDPPLMYIPVTLESLLLQYLLYSAI